MTAIALNYLKPDPQARTEGTAPERPISSLGCVL